MEITDSRAMHEDIKKTNTIIGENIRTIRKQTGLSQRDLGQYLDITFQQFQKYEMGTNRISAASLFQLSNQLNIPIEQFFERLPILKKETLLYHKHRVLIQELEACQDDKFTRAIRQLIRHYSASSSE